MAELGPHTEKVGGRPSAVPCRLPRRARAKPRRRRPDRTDTTNSTRAGSRVRKASRGLPGLTRDADPPRQASHVKHGQMPGLPDG